MAAVAAPRGRGGAGLGRRWFLGVGFAAVLGVFVAGGAAFAWPTGIGAGRVLTQAVAR